MVIYNNPLMTRARLFPGRIPMMTGLVAVGTSHPPPTKLGSLTMVLLLEAPKLEYLEILSDRQSEIRSETPQGVSTQEVLNNKELHVFRVLEAPIVWFSSIFVWVRLCGLHFIPDMKGIFYKLWGGIEMFMIMKQFQVGEPTPFSNILI